MEGTVDRPINKHFCSQMNPEGEKTKVNMVSVRNRSKPRMRLFLVSGD